MGKKKNKAKAGSVHAPHSRVREGKKAKKGAGTTAALYKGAGPTAVLRPIPNGGGGKKRWWQCVQCASAFSKRSKARRHACAAASGVARTAAKLVADCQKLIVEREQARAPASSAPGSQFWMGLVHAAGLKLRAEPPAPAQPEQAPAPAPDEEWKERGGKLMRQMG